MDRISVYLKKNSLVIIIAIVASVVFFTNLSGQGYSLDEPETVILAESISKYGFPSPWDGQNLVSTNNGRDIIFLNNNYFWQWQPWLQHYLIFSGINLFGNSLFGQRVLFALLGVGTVLLTFFTGKELFKNKYISFAISFQLIFLLPFFLYARSARYYSPSIFFSFLVFYLIILRLKNKWTRKHSWIFSFINLLLFFSNYIVWLTTSIFVFVVSLSKKDKRIFYILVPQMVLAVAWFIVFKPYSGDALIFNQFMNFPINIVKNFSYINSFVFPLIFLPFIFILKKKDKFLLTISFLIVLKTIIYSIFLIPHGRYLSDLFPIFILIFGYFYEYLIARKKITLMFLLFFVVIFTNIFNLIPYIFVPNHKLIFNFWPEKYYAELTGKYQTIMPQLGHYLEDKYKKGDLFLSNGYPWYIYSYSRVPAISPICDKKSNRFLGPKDIIDKAKIRWIIVFPFDKNYYFPCMNFRSLKDIEVNYRLIKLRFDKDTRVVNDVDVFNRQFPPIKIREGEVYLFEKKE